MAKAKVSGSHEIGDILACSLLISTPSGVTQERLMSW